MATTENITVLFTDLVGSTELASSLTPEAGDEVRRKHFSALRQAMATSGGTEVKNLGDGLMVVFPAASAALSCAVAMQQVVHRDNAGAERPLGLRVGLSSGEATREADDYFGDPVVEAARLCAQAEGGQILASDLVRANAGRRSSHTFTSLGELELKGLSERIETLDVSWEPLGADAPGSGRVPLPTRLTNRPAVGVIGREPELALLDTSAKRVASGEGRELILLAGEPGQGKTTLVSELARHVHDGGMTVVLGRCDEEVGAPYRPFQEALSHLVAHIDEELLRTHVASHGGELARMVPALGQRLGELPPPQTTDPDTERYLLYAAVVGVLEEAARQRPVVLVLDDLHWADKPSLQLLRHLVTNTSTSRLLMLGTYRDGELSAAHPLTEALAALHRELAEVSTIDLKGLEDTGVIAFMESAAGHALDDAGVGLAHQLYQETDGNPFFVAEVLRHLSETGAIVQDATGRWTTADEGHLALPHSVRAVIGTRVSRLGEEAAKVLSTASVIGRDFDLEVLAELTKVAEDDLIDLLKAAQHAAVVNELPDSPGRYSFAHALIQHTLYEDLGVNRRTRVHKSVGEAIERLYGAGSDERVGELARHFLMAMRPTDSEKAIAYARRAGDRAMSLLAPDEALRWYTQALEALDADPAADTHARACILVGLGKAQKLCGVAAYRDTLLEAARQADQIDALDLLVQAALSNNRGFQSTISWADTERIAIIDRALERLEDPDAADRARLLALASMERIYMADLDERLQLATQAVDTARRSTDVAALAEVLYMAARALIAPSTLEMRATWLDEASRLADAFGDPAARYAIHETLMQIAVEKGDLDTILAEAAITKDIVAQLPNAQSRWRAACDLALIAILSGDLVAAEQFAESALNLGIETGQPDAMRMFGAQLINIRKRQGRLNELVPVLEQVAADSPLAVYRAVLALACLGAGQTAEAQVLLDAERRAGFVIGEDSQWSSAHTYWAEAAVKLGDMECAHLMRDRLAPFSAQVVTTTITVSPAIAYYLGVVDHALGHVDDADAWFRQAMEIHQRLNSPALIAMTQAAWADLLVSRGLGDDRTRARGHVEEALATATAGGYGEVQVEAERVLTRLEDPSG